ncbi:ABC transporter permease subunit [Catenulispora sp. NF23]|uniref:ABC transporter permease subunit n=1 Tax=Catenulispora pinistramenti TaxID=2705254 RepID=A0ABS5KXH7_9ACTN|nr:ABC transporter permease subunit [Catenulispora pinistramenti]MBS2539467.1 ABC transporter permease subunit [Catenulispora pinistramenti]MBS2550727.1 ABC transporter permease subunit [Catenulispora pinistramenti]
MSAIRAFQAVRSGRIDSHRVRAVLRKEVTDYRRNRFVLGTMTVLPILFLVNPIINIFTAPTTVSHTALDARVGSTMLFMLLVPVILPATISATSIVNEREQGTLEPVLTTPVRSEELLIGKALAALIPAVAIAYTMLGIFLLMVKLFAHQQVADATLEGPRILAQVLFIPLLAGWAIWAGLAVSVRANDVRVAQQLGTLASLPPLAITALMAFNVITPSFRVAVLFAVGLLLLDVMAYRLIAPMFDRERLITARGAK